MSHRKVVCLNLDEVKNKIKEVFRHNVIFCEKMGRAHNWVTDWNRKDKDGNPAPKNLPSPEEAARMCVLLQTTPEEILTEQADIELVNSLIEAERGKAPEKGAPAEVGGGKDALLDFIRKTDDRTTLLAVLDEVNKKLQEMQ